MDARETVSFTQGQTERLCRRICREEGVSGCVLLSTCNRTELYLSGAENLSPAQLLCTLAGAPEAQPLLVERRGAQAERHLMRVACGLCSQILGEDQIVSQVKRAYQTAHEQDSADAQLSQLFRLAVTAGKRSRAQVRLSAAPLSVAGQAVEQLEQALGELRGKRALVIGNGEMGRLASGLLVDRGCDVTVTLRSYRHGVTVVPSGCRTVPYNERMSCLSQCDILLSATTSPHYTVTYDDLAAQPHLPQAVCDLAMPRDIQPTVRALVPVFFDMDSMGGRDAYVAPDDRAKVEAIIEEQLEELARWRAYRHALPLVEELSELAAQRVLTGYAFAELIEDADSGTAEKMKEAARLAAHKTVHLLLRGMQGEWDDAALETCRDAILRKAPQLKGRKTG